MHSFIAAAALLASTAAASSVGSAIVVNACEYEVYVYNTPAEGGGYSQIDQTLSSNETYQQTWTELSNAQGWSIKLSKDTTLSNIMQYEYTFHDDGTIWYDLSDVNGNPWDGNWEITATNAEDDCNPKDQAYRYSTDDAYGMQACSQDSVITVTLCSGESQDDGSAASESSSVASATSTASQYSTPASSPTTVGAATTSASSQSSAASATGSIVQATTTTSSSNGHFTWGHEYNADSTTSPSATTLSTVTSSAVTTDGAGVTVTEVDTAVVTDVVTATAYQRFRRHQHHAHGHEA